MTLENMRNHKQRKMQHQTNDNCVQMPYESWKSAIPSRSLHCPPSCLIFMTRDTGDCVCVCACMDPAAFHTEIYTQHNFPILQHYYNVSPSQPVHDLNDL